MSDQAKTTTCRVESVKGCTILYLYINKVMSFVFKEKKNLRFIENCLSEKECAVR